MVTRRFYKFDLLTITIIVLVGLIHLPYPFAGDQALFTLCALKLHQGALLYKDFWDLKQPGIYGFYLLAGKLFGFDEVGVHLLELIYMLAFSVVLILGCRDYFRSRSLVSLVPLLTVGFYYGVAASHQLTQLEVLVGFPIFLSLYCACQAVEPNQRGARFLFLSGFMGGVVLTFKLVLLPIPLSFWVTSLVIAAKRKKSGLASELLRGCWPILMGALLPLLVVLCLFASLHDVGPLLYTAFTYPLQVMTELPKEDRIGTLLTGLQWFLGNFAPLLALGFIGAWLSLVRCRDVMSVNLVLWVVVGVFVILLQRYSWWDYHYLLVLVPLGILSAKGVEGAWERLPPGHIPARAWSERVFVLVALLLLFSPVLDSWAMLGLRPPRVRTESRGAAAVPSQSQSRICEGGQRCGFLVAARQSAG